jgi:ABC-type Na+ efflux pump permease subunit
LRVQSRKRSTYSARVGWGLAAVALLLFFTLNFPNQSADGRYVLSTIHFCLAVMLFVLAPVGASDSISREKREGTLGLLLLTKLTPPQVVLGKLAAHFIRLFYIAFMMLPFIMIPVLLGGVELPDFLLSTVALFAIAAAGVAAGLIVSAVLLNFGVAISWAIILTALIGLLVSSSVANAALLLFPNRFAGVDLSFRLFLFGPAVLLVPLLASEVARIYVASPWFFWFVDAGLIYLSILFLRFAVWFCARKIAQHTEFAGETKRQVAFRKRFLTPILWRKRYRRTMGRKLDRNPFIWLEYRTAWARAARWAMILLAIGAETVLVNALPKRAEFIGAHFFVLSILLVFLTFKSSSSFHREKESGAFELLLVTPLTARQIVTGRLRAVASYYGLTVFLIAAFGLYGLTWTHSPWFEDPLAAAVNILSVGSSIVSVPICGLFFALRYNTFLPALLWTAGVAILAPIFVWTAFNGILWYTAVRIQWPLAMLLYQTLREIWWPVLLVVAAYHIFISCHCARASVRLLKRREFAARS